MYLIKTPAGQQAFKERHGDLSQRLRSAFLLFDGTRSVTQVQEMTAALGVSMDDILMLVSKGWLEKRKSPAMAGGAEILNGVLPEKSTDSLLAPSAASPDCLQIRYQRAYPVAVSITGALGLKGFRLNLAVEAAMGYSQLAALAPRIRGAVGEAAYLTLHHELFEPDDEKSLNS